MVTLQLCLAVAFVFAVVALLMAAVPRMQKAKYKRMRRWNNTRPKHDLTRPPQEEEL